MISALLGDILRRLRSAEAYEAVSEALAAGDDQTLAAPALIRPLLVAALFAEHPGPTLVLIPGEEAAERFARQVGELLPRHDVLRLPARSDMPWEDVQPDLGQVGRRARALHSLAQGRPRVVVASASALLRRLPPRDAQVFEPVALAEGGSLDIESTASRLARMGYERVDAAEAAGNFAIRGGILDVFPSDGQYPIRAELFGDEIESLTKYLPSTQQTLGKADPVEVYPCREVMLGSRAATYATRRLHDRALKDQEVAHHLELIQQGVYFNGVERYLPVFYRVPGTVTDYATPETLVVVIEPRALFEGAVRSSEEIGARAAAAGMKALELFCAPAEIDVGGRQRLTLIAIVRDGTSVDAELPARRPDVAGGEERLADGVRALIGAGHAVTVCVPEREARHRLTDSLTASGFSVAELASSAISGEEADDVGGDAPPETVVRVSRADVAAGLVVPQAKLAVIGMSDVYPRGLAGGRRKAEVDVMSFPFAPGDWVVHSTHGIALLRDVMRQEVAGVERDYLLLEYAKGDKLYVPVDHLDKVTKYVGPDGAAPKVTRLNTADWSRATKKARKAARKLAFDLVDLYSRRMAVEGHAFGSDTPWQMEMEAAFPFEETPDQLAAIADVKADMESDRPMDRLICGDVGYGKTEVAIRAAFKATQDGRQVMVLCPTTILAQQHFTTFSERFAPFPLRVEVLSRFRTAGQQAEALRGFAEGKVDVLIGTHRLLSPDVAPRDLGLVIVDEEHRFGVEHKEHVKHLREQVDVLTLTATPIPRTLQMSLTGVRDLSVIDTPPRNRFPVQVHVREYDPAVVSEAIRAELERGGQVYYVSNRVARIDDAVRRVQKAAPEARIAVAHGQMSEHRLERVMESFAANEADVLVATTIIESGIDNPHTNTLVIEDSQRLGLAQLYQLKGRVGRSHVRASAYFLFPRGASLTDQAYERLTAIQEHRDLGAGMQVAMRDLEIRGAGSLLGAEQHGNMSAVGFDLYAQMLREAVIEARGEAAVAFPDVRVDLPVPAFLPEEYVSDAAERVALYRRLAASRTPEAVELVCGDIVDSYGLPPVAVRNLLDIARVRALAGTAGVSSVAVVRKRLVVHPVRLDEEQRGRVAALGGMHLEREAKTLLPLGVDDSPTGVAIALLGAILSDAVSVT